MGFAEGKAGVEIVVEGDLGEREPALVTPLAVVLVVGLELAPVGIGMAICTRRAFGSFVAASFRGGALERPMTGGARHVSVGSIERETRPFSVVESRA